MSTALITSSGINVLMLLMLLFLIINNTIMSIQKRNTYVIVILLTIVVINAEKIAVTGKKAQDKKYYRHSGYPGGIKETNFTKLIAHKPEDVLHKAVKGMLPKGPLGYAMIKKLKVYAEGSHPHSAQQPQPLEL